MASNENSSVPARLKDLKDSVKERFLGLLGIRQPKVLLEDEQEVFLQVGRTVWHAPRQLRIELWLSSLARRHSLVSEYQAYLCQEISREAATDIEKDVQRTFPNTRRFHAEEGQTQLRNVLRAYAAYDPEVAYCQGMNFLTGLLLMYMPTEAHAFAALVVLMEDRKLRSFYHRSMSLLQVQLWQLSRLISPPLNQHLETLGVVPMLYGASWLMTAFSADFPIPFSARIMDVLLADQCECALLKVAAAIMKAVGSRLYAMSDLEEVLGHLKLEVPAWDEPDLHDLLTAAFTKPWTPRQLSILRSTEGAETVAQAMDRVMNMHEQLSAQTCDDEEGGEEGGAGGGGDGEARAALTVPRLQPPPQAFNSFTASPACGTPINGGLYGTGSHGGAASGSPPAPVSGSATAAVVTAASGSSGGAPPSALDSMNSGGSTTCGNAALMSFQGAVSVSTSPAAWGIPCIHPNVPASPAIQAFRRAHLTSLQAAANSATGSSFPFHHPVRSSYGGGANGGHEESGLLSARDEDIDGSPQSGYMSSYRCGYDGCSLEDWGDFNAAAVRQQWRSIVRAAPGSTRHVLMHHDELVAGADGPWRGASAASSLSAFSSHGGAQAAPPTPSSRESSSGSASQPIPVPSGRGGLNSGASAIGSAFAAAAAAANANAAVSSLPSAATAAIGKPPLPPRCASLDRAGPALLGAFSRLSVVSEDPLIVQMGAVAPAPSPRGSMDLHMMGRNSSQQLESCEQQGFLLCGTGVGGAGGSATVANGVGVGSASCNGDCVSGMASATTGGVLLSPSAISGVVSPHGLPSPRVLSGWCTSALTAGASGIGGGRAGGATGSDTPTGDYMPLGLDRAMSGSLLDYSAGCTGGCGAALTSMTERSFSTASQMPAAPAILPPMRPTMASAGLLPTDEQCSMFLRDQSQATSNVVSQQIDDQEHQPSDMATDIAGDILRMLSAVDTGNAHAAYDPRAILGESMYADSPNKEEHKLVRRGSETLRHLPSSSALADMAAQDLAKAQEEAERVRLELQAQLEQQRASERLSSCLASGTERGVSTSVLAASVGAEAAGSSGGVTEAQLAEAAAEAGAVAATAVAAAEGAVAAAGGNGSGTVAAAEATAGTTPPVGMSSAAGGAGAGVDEVVFKRPTLYVDGIPMFDPKSLMADNHEAQVMFTPTVSPGASSYADPVMSGFTPTGDAATPGDRDGGGDGNIEVDSAAPAALTTAIAKWDMPHAAVRSSESGEEAGSVASAIMEVAEMTHPMDADNHVIIPAETEACTVLPVQNGSDDVIVRTAETSGGVEDLAASASAAPSKAVTSAGGTALSEEELPTLPSASEWVDWSQAPPIQVVPPVVLPLSQGPAASASASAAQSAATSPQHVDTNMMLSEAQAEAPLVPVLQSFPSFQLQGPMGQSLNHDLIDMASPVRPMRSLGAQRLQLSPGAEGCGPSGEIPDFPEHGIAGTGLSPGVPVAVERSLNLDAVRPPPGSFSDLAAGGGGSLKVLFCTSTSSSQSPLPYGLLPMASSAAQPPPMAPAISFASSMAEGPSCNGVSSLLSVSMMTGRSTSFVGVLRSELINPTNPSRDPLCPNVQTGIPNDVAHHSSEESDRCCGFDDDDRERYASCRQTPGSPQGCISPKWLLVSGQSGSVYDVSNGGSHRVADVQGTGATDEVEGGFCTAPRLRVMAEVVLPESSAQEPGSSFAWESPSSNVGSSAAAAATVAPVIAAAAAKPFEATPNGKPQQQLQPGPVARSQLNGSCLAMPRPAAVSNDGDAGSWPGGLGHMELGNTSSAASRGSLVEHQVSVEADVEGEELENSPFRAALSPSLAHHIMSAYYRSEQHQQQQEQRELEERQREQERLAQEQLHQVQQLVMDLGAPAVAGHPSGLKLSDVVAATAAVVPVFDLSGAAATSTATAVPVLSLHVESTVIATNTGVGHAAVAGEPSLSGAPVLTVPSGVVSPALESPGRPNAVHGTGYSTTAALHQPYVMNPSTTMALTPFALSSGDPSSSRLTAELQQVIPPPLQPLMIHPDTTSQHLGSTGYSLQAEGKSHVSGLASLRCTGSGDGGGVATATAGGGLSNGALGSAIVVARLSSSGAMQPVSLLVHGTSDGNVHCPSIGSSGATMPADVGTAVGTSGLQPPAGHVCHVTMRTDSGSNGGAPLQLLSLPPAPVLCSSNVTVTAVAEGEGGGGVAACTPVATISGGCGALSTALVQPAVPTWTATFDGVDDTPKGATADEEAAAKCSSGPEPRVLSSAFSAEADTPPLAPLLESSSGSGRNVAVTTTDISTPEARGNVADMVRGISIEVTASTTRGAFPELLSRNV